jgi:DNA-binding response OmpR family regulator
MESTADTKTVLIVEDDTELREALKTALTYEKFRALTAQNGEEGLALALKERPDLILLDVVMPKMDGLEMLTRLREDAWGKTTPVIVMTVLDDLSKIAEVVSAGGDEYVIKSDVTLGSLVAKVKTRIAREVERMQKPHK